MVLRISSLIFSLIISIFFVIISISSATIDRDEIYRGCQSPIKRCYGDVEGCINHKNCTFSVAVTENSTHFGAELQNSCNGDADNFFIGIGVHAIWKSDGKQIGSYNCTPKLDDFKFVILWTGEKCPKLGNLQKRWGQIEKGIVPNCPTQAQPVEDLLTYVNRQMLVNAGNIPVSLIEDQRFKVIDDGKFFTNAGLRLFPLNTVIIFLITYLFSKFI